MAKIDSSHGQLFLRQAHQPFSSVTLLSLKPYVLVSPKDQTPSPSLCDVIYSWLSRPSAARGAVQGFPRLDPLRSCKSFIHLKTPIVKSKNKRTLGISNITLFFYNFLLLCSLHNHNFLLHSKLLLHLTVSLPVLPYSAI